MDKAYFEVPRPELFGVLCGVLRTQGAGLSELSPAVADGALVHPEDSPDLRVAEVRHADEMLEQVLLLRVQALPGAGLRPCHVLHGMSSHVSLIVEAVLVS